jgi:hypothetical protein
MKHYAEICVRAASSMHRQVKTEQPQADPVLKAYNPLTEQLMDTLKAS